MKSFIWNSNFETGVAVIDEQHQELVKIINTYSHLLANNSATIENIDQTLEELITYTKFHFCEEEALMSKIGLDPRHIKLHKDLHNGLVEEINAMIPKNYSDKFLARTHILDLIIHWLAYHILGTDMNMAKQMAAIESGISAETAFELEEKNKDKSTEPLLEALNGLFAQVSVRNKELQAFNLSLEEKVVQRTEELNKLNKELESLSLTDSLTEMPNRRYAIQQLALLWKESNVNLKPIVCLMIDADYFKSINDTYGHDVGDLFLIKLGLTLKHSIRNDDLACRLGGDEFLVLCPKTDLRGGLYLADIIAKKFSLLNIEVDGKNIDIKLSLSIGVAEKTSRMLDYEELLKVADEGTYKAKADGRNCIKTVQLSGNDTALGQCSGNA
jgi:diguanylate cyclase (GGDEF)-like protein/hemerythrin-like metal-binding protein